MPESQSGEKLPAMLLKTEVPVEKRQNMILEAI